MGCSDTAVHKAIKSGKIVKGVILKDGKRQIIFEVAQAEWQATFSTSRVQNPKLAEKVLGESSASPVPQPESIQAVQSKAKAQQVESFFKAKLKQLEYEKEIKKVVDKDKVYKVLYGMGKEIRKALMAIPDRVIDDVLAAPTRQHAHTILQEAIATVLESVPEILNRPIYE